MKKSLLRMSSIGAIIVMLIVIFGCQGYQPPEYKAPGDVDDEEVIEIDVSDIGEEVDIGEEMEAEEEAEVEVRYPPEPELEPAATVKATTKPRYEEVTYEEAEEVDVEETESDFKKSAYKPIVEEEGIPTMTVTEGDLVKLNVKATDADGDTLSYSFTAPLNSEGKWQTRMGDSGVYYSTITVSDGKTEVVKKIKIVVEPENNKPELNFIPDQVVEEGDTVKINAYATDADGDKLTITYSGWMTSDTKEVGYDQEGEHIVVVSVTDGISKVSQEVKITVEDVNRPPEVEIEF